MAEYRFWLSNLPNWFQGKTRFRVFPFRPSNLGLFGSSLQTAAREKKEKKKGKRGEKRKKCSLFARCFHLANPGGRRARPVVKKKKKKC